MRGPGEGGADQGFWDRPPSSGVSERPCKKLYISPHLILAHGSVNSALRMSKPKCWEEDVTFSGMLSELTLRLAPKHTHFTYLTALNK